MLTVSPCYVFAVCGSTDVRNTVDRFKLLVNCTVIEGSLQILLIDYADPSQYDDLSFPSLVEITDFLLLYRVYGLKTLAQLFPNLSVIRGRSLFYNYALVAFEMPDLEEVGLFGLRKIERGAIRLEKNPKLCYVNTVLWNALTDESIKKDDNFIVGNKDPDECVDVCPTRADTDRSYCPQVTIHSDTNGDVLRKQSLCWNADNCQPREFHSLTSFLSRALQSRAAYLNPCRHVVIVVDRDSLPNRNVLATCQSNLMHPHEAITSHKVIT